ncbi:MAG: hypothetical protein ABI377_01835 [Devosia sp.]
MLAHRLIPAVFLIAVLFASALPALADDATSGPTKLTPLQIGQVFCISRVGNDMAPVEAIVTPSLKQAIAKADALDAAWQKKNPGEKPPLGDGLPWQASPDYTANCTASDSATTGKDARVNISYSFADDPAGNYTDVLELKPELDKDIGDNVWRIDDVMFADKSTMRQQMVDAFKP